MKVSVTPEKFAMVHYEAAEIADVVAEVAAAVGLPDDLDIGVEIDETTPLGKAFVKSVDPVVLSLESGALEDPKKPRQFSRPGAADVLGRLLFRLHDRRDPSFGDPPPDADQILPQAVAWDVYCIGRLVRLGYRHHDNRQRRLYHFRTRHGFTDAADEAFDRLWTADHLTWSEIAALSDGARSEPAPA